jgi:hypothetical protein
MDEMLINKLYIDGEYEQVVSRLELGVVEHDDITKEMLYKLLISAALTGDADARSGAIALIAERFGGVDPELFRDIAHGHMDELMIAASLTGKE